MRNQARFMTDKGTVTVTAQAITASQHLGDIILTAIQGGGWHLRRTIPAADITQVTVSGRDRQYVTGNRAAGVVLTGGVALLAPSRMRGALVITTTGGDVLAFTLKRSSAKQPEAVAAQFTALGYPVI